MASKSKLDKKPDGRWRIIPARGLAPVLSGALLFCLLLVGIWPDLGLNLAAEIVGVIFTVAVVDVIIRSRDKARLAPVLLAADQDAWQLAVRARRLVEHGLRSTITAGEVANMSGKEPMSALDGPLSRVRLAEPIDVVDRTGRYVPFYIYLNDERDELRAQAQMFAARYTAVAEPVLLEAVRAIENSIMLKIKRPFEHNDRLAGGYFARLAESAEATAALATPRGVIFDAGDYFEPLKELVQKHPIRSTEAPYRP